MHALQIAADRLRAERHRAVHPGADPSRPAARNVAAEAGWNLNAGLDVAVLQPLFEIGVTGERQLFGEVARAAQLFEIDAAFVSLVMIEDRERQTVDIG